MAQNGCPIWLVAQKAIVGFQFIAYFGIPNVSNSNQNHCQIYIRGRSQTTLTKFCPFLTTYTQDALYYFI